MIEGLWGHALCMDVRVLSVHYNNNFKSCWEISGKLNRCRNLKILNVYMLAEIHIQIEERDFINSHNEGKKAV